MTKIKNVLLSECKTDNKLCAIMAPFFVLWYTSEDVGVELSPLLISDVEIETLQSKRNDFRRFEFAAVKYVV